MYQAQNNNRNSSTTLSSHWSIFFPNTGGVFAIVAEKTAGPKCSCKTVYSQQVWNIYLTQHTANVVQHTIHWSMQVQQHHGHVSRCLTDRQMLWRWAQKVSTNPEIPPANTHVKVRWTPPAAKAQLKNKAPLRYSIILILTSVHLYCPFWSSVHGSKRWLSSAPSVEAALRHWGLWPWQQPDELVIIYPLMGFMSCKIPHTEWCAHFVKCQPGFSCQFLWKQACVKLNHLLESPY